MSYLTNICRLGFFIHVSQCEKSIMSVRGVKAQAPIGLKMPKFVHKSSQKPLRFCRQRWCEEYLWVSPISVPGIYLLCTRILLVFSRTCLSLGMPTRNPFRVEMKPSLYLKGLPLYHVELYKPGTKIFFVQFQNCELVLIFKAKEKIVYRNHFDMEIYP